MTRSDPHGSGASFQTDVLNWFVRRFSDHFEEEKAIPIGSPPRLHRFDIVNDANIIAAECKCYAWTETGNVPGAKIGSCNEAAFYLSFLPDSFDKYIVFRCARHSKRAETLAEYYYRTYRHLLGAIHVAEYAPEADTMWILGSGDSGR